MEVYVNPDNDYQRFVNAFVRKHPHGEQKQIIKKANELWKTIKSDKEKVNEFMGSAPPKKKAKRQESSRSAKSLLKRQRKLPQQPRLRRRPYQPYQQWLCTQTPLLQRQTLRLSRK